MKVNDITEKAGRAVRENVAHIIFAAVVALLIVLSFVNLGRGDGVIAWADLAVNIALQVSVFVPYRWRQKHISGQAEPYKTNKERCGQRVEEIHAQNALSSFAAFCEVKTAELKRIKQLDIVHAAGIDTAVYDSGKYDMLTAAQKKAIERAKRVRVRPINPLCITSNGARVRGYGVDFNEEAEDVKGILGKILPMIVWAVILSVIAVDSLKYGGISAMVMILFRIVMCLTSMFSGIMSGEGFVIKKDKVILRRIDFIELFHEWESARALTEIGNIRVTTNGKVCPEEEQPDEEVGI